MLSHAGKRDVNHVIQTMNGNQILSCDASPLDKVQVLVNETCELSVFPNLNLFLAQRISSA
jgi:hypothetical protein